MKPQSAKAKGRNHQKWIVEKILETFPELSPADVNSRSMGANGTDVMLSEAAQAKVPYRIEAKSLASSAVYKLYEQAVSHDEEGEPLLILKANRKQPLAIITAEHFFALLRKLNG